jgi:predicted RNA-binding protein with EMAP domain
MATEREKTDHFRELMDEKFKGLTSLVNAQFESVNDKLEEIHNEAKKTNSRVNHLEEQRDKYLETRVSIPMLKDLTTEVKEIRTELDESVKWTHRYVERRAIDCPVVDDIKECKDKIVTIEKDLTDVNFVIRHPKLFIAVLVVITLLTLATFLEGNPFNVFYKDTPKIETVK